MSLLMPDQVGAVSEGFLTFATHVGFVPTTDFVWHDQVSGLEEGFSTLVAFTGVTSSVNSLVLKKRSDAVKGFPKFTVIIEFVSSLRLLPFHASGWNLCKIIWVRN